MYVVWQDFFDSIGNNEIFLIKSIDNGSTFSTPINLSKDRGASLTPYIAVSGSNVYVVWSDDNNYFLHLSPRPGYLRCIFYEKYRLWELASQEL